MLRRVSGLYETLSKVTDYFSCDYVIVTYVLDSPDVS